MKVKIMSEPISGAAGAAAGWKILGGVVGLAGIGAGLSAYVVMCMTKPQDDREWRVALICTVMGSIGGGASLIWHFKLQPMMHDPFGLVGLLGLSFACGLPAWMFVRLLFNAFRKRRDADLLDVIKEVKDAL